MLLINLMVNFNNKKIMESVALNTKKLTEKLHEKAYILSI